MAAGSGEVSYTIRLKDHMSGQLKKLGLSASAASAAIKKGLVGGLKAARVALKAFAVAATAAAAAAAGIAFAAVRMGKSFLQAAASLEDTQKKFSVVFSGVEDDANAMAESISKGLKIGQGSVMGFMGTFQDTLVPMGFARDEAMGMSGALTSLAADLAAFNPGIKDTADATAALQSVMVGMNRSALRFGVVLNETKIQQEALNLGLVKGNEELTEQDKVMARLSLVMKGTADAQGAFLRNQNGLTVQTIQFQEAVQDLREEMGLRLKETLQLAVQRMGGVQVAIDAVRLGFEFFTRVLSEVLIPAVGNALTNFGKFVEGLGGMDEAVMTVSDTVLLIAEVFGVMWNSVKLVLHYFEQGLNTVVYAFEALWSILKIVAGVAMLNFVSMVNLAAKAVTWWYRVLDEVIVWMSNTMIAVLSSVAESLADVIAGFSGMARWAAQIPGIGEEMLAIAAAGDAAAIGIRMMAGGLKDTAVTKSPIGVLADEIEAFSGTIPAFQSDLQKFILTSWDGLKEQSSEYVDSIMEDVPAIEELWRKVRAGGENVGADWEALQNKVVAAQEAMNQLEVVTPEQQEQVAVMADHLARLAAPLDGVKGAQDEAAQAAYSLADAFNDAGVGATSFAAKIPEMGQSMQELTSGALDSFASGLTNAFMSILDGSKTAGEAFRMFAAQFLMDVSRMIIQSLILQAIRSAIVGFADGGVIEGGLGHVSAFADGGTVSGGLGRFMPVKGYATGGPIVNKPHVALIGEGQYNEAVVPLPDGKSIPVQMQGGGGASVNVNISATDAAGVDKLLYDRKGTLQRIIADAISESRSFRSAVSGA